MELSLMRPYLIGKVVVKAAIKSYHLYFEDALWKKDWDGKGSGQKSGFNNVFSAMQASFARLVCYIQG